MRFLIVALLLFSCYSSSLYAKKAKALTATTNSAEKLINFSKKQRNSLKTELFANQIDYLNLSYQNHSLVAVHFVKLLNETSIYLTKHDFDYALNTRFSYHFVFQHLYPKHSFW